MDANAASPANRLLAGLDIADLDSLRPHLRQVSLPERKVLEGRNRPVEAVYFPDSGLASVVVSTGSRHTAEAGVIGNEGATGHSLVLGVDRSPYEVFMQASGSGWRIASDALLGAMEERPGLRAAMLRHVYLFQVQTSFTALANARYRLEERLARWLLMAQDRLGDDLDLTHEFLSLMLGVRRPGVTISLGVFEERKLIRTHRGGLTVLDRTGLEDAANGSYGAPEAEYQRLFTPAPLCADPNNFPKKPFTKVNAARP